MCNLTILSVSFADERFILFNRDLTQKLNPGIEYNWLVVDNSCLGKYESRSSSNFLVLEGLPHEEHKDRASYHHALGLAKGLTHVKSRYLLVIDHDFYVVRPGWIRDVISNMESKGLSFFGSVWNPYWDYQYRYFPSVHFMLIDLKRVPIETVNFTPEIENQRLTPLFWTTAFRIGRFRDTGYKIYKRYYSDSQHKTELLVPYFLPSWKTGRYVRYEQKIHRILPDLRCVIPKRENYFVTESFLQTMCPYGYDSRWEEFTWNNKPFSFHLRGFGRKNCSKSDDIMALEKFVGSKYL
jgi:hypothetical protein